MNYSELDDWAINTLVDGVLNHAPVDCAQSKDYCNSWADAGPIIQENYLSVECDDMFDAPMPSSYWKAHNPKGNHYTDKDPLRAAMIVFLMMQEEK